MKAVSKADETQNKILDAALQLFRKDGYDTTTMRGIAEAAGVATGAAYYYFPSKDAIVLAFYQRSAEEMQPHIEKAIGRSKSLEGKLHDLIAEKLRYFSPDRGILRALLRSGTDPSSPVSPFSNETKAIRETDTLWFRRILDDAGMRIPKDLAPHIPEVLWFFQMGIILFWVLDDSPKQIRTTRLLNLGCKSTATLLKVSNLPLMRPLRKTVLEVISIVKEES
jgi:AcrR family transcriptional regulator